MRWPLTQRPLVPRTVLPTLIGGGVGWGSLSVFGGYATSVWAPVALSAASHISEANLKDIIGAGCEILSVGLAIGAGFEAASTMATYRQQRRLDATFKDFNEIIAAYHPKAGGADRTTYLAHTVDALLAKRQEAIDMLVSKYKKKPDRAKEEVDYLLDQSLALSAKDQQYTTLEIGARLAISRASSPEPIRSKLPKLALAGGTEAFVR